MGENMDATMKNDIKALLEDADLEDDDLVETVKIQLKELYGDSVKLNKKVIKRTVKAWKKAKQSLKVENEKPMDDKPKRGGTEFSDQESEQEMAFENSIEKADQQPQGIQSFGKVESVKITGTMVAEEEVTSDYIQTSVENSLPQLSFFEESSQSSTMASQESMIQEDLSEADVNEGMKAVVSFLYGEDVDKCTINDVRTMLQQKFPGVKYPKAMVKARIVQYLNDVNQEEEKPKKRPTSNKKKRKVLKQVSSDNSEKSEHSEEDAYSEEEPRKKKKSIVRKKVVSSSSDDSDMDISEIDSPALESMSTELIKKVATIQVLNREARALGLDLKMLPIDDLNTVLITEGFRLLEEISAILGKSSPELKPKSEKFHGLFPCLDKIRIIDNITVLAKRTELLLRLRDIYASNAVVSRFAGSLQRVAGYLAKRVTLVSNNKWECDPHLLEQSTIAQVVHDPNSDQFLGFQSFEKLASSRMMYVVIPSCSVVPVLLNGFKLNPKETPRLSPGRGLVFFGTLSDAVQHFDATLQVKPGGSNYAFGVSVACGDILKVSLFRNPLFIRC